MTRFVPALAALAPLALLAVPATAAPAPAAPATPIHLRYGVALIGLPIGTATVDGAVGAKDYKLSGTGKLTGIAGVFVDTKGAVTSTGALKDGRVIPSGFAATAGTPHYVLTIRMSEEKNAATQVVIDPMYQQTPDRIPLSPADKRNIIDPMSSFIMPVPGTGELLGPAACDRTLPLFDGGVRFNINLSFKRLQQVATPAYTGPVAVCGARYQPISGYRPDRPVNKFMADNKDMEVWLAPVGDTRFVYPHHVAVMSMIGMVTIDATEAAIGAPVQAAVAH
jgi:hypothetical protein